MSYLGGQKVQCPSGMLTEEERKQKTKWEEEAKKRTAAEAIAQRYYEECKGGKKPHCYICGTTFGLLNHHLVYDTKAFEVTLPMCKRCHYEAHH